MGKLKTGDVVRFSGEPSELGFDNSCAQDPEWIVVQDSETTLAVANRNFQTFAYVRHAERCFNKFEATGENVLRSPSGAVTLQKESDSFGVTVRCGDQRLTVDLGEDGKVYTRVWPFWLQDNKNMPVLMNGTVKTTNTMFCKRLMATLRSCGWSKSQQESAVQLLNRLLDKRTLFLNRESARA